MKNKKFRLHDYVFMAAGILLFLTMMSIWLICGLFAKYTIKDSASHSARVAQFGNAEVKEHQAVLKGVADNQKVKVVYSDDMIYYLSDDEVSDNTYDKIMPGVDIPKDPFVRVTPGEVDCELYIKVTNNNFPRPYKDSSGEEHGDLISYKIDDEKWNKITYKNEVIYKYKGTIDANFESENGYIDIPILKDNKIYISQYYDADTYSSKKESFSLTFESWLVQID